MQSIRWPTRLADAGALACAGALFAAMALELPARAESRAAEAANAAPVATDFRPAASPIGAPPAAADARAGS